MSELTPSSTIDALNTALAGLTLSSLRFELKFEAPLRLSPYYASTLRGGLGLRFRKLVCVQPQIKNCRDCGLLHACAFPYVFETPLPPTVANAPHLQEVSPYVLRTGSAPAHLAAGDTLTFELLLFGKAIDYLPYFVISYRQLGNSGLGAERARFALTHVIDETPNGFAQVLYAGDSGVINLEPSRVTLAELLPRSTNQVERISVRFLTPTRIKSHSKITNTPTFRDLLASLLRRLAQLVIVHGHTQWSVDEKTILAQAEVIETTGSQIKPVTWSRFSSRQQQTIRMGGITGDLEFSGNLQPFLPLLWAGQYLHVGRGATFGNGQYQLRLHR